MTGTKSECGHRTGLLTGVAGRGQTAIVVRVTWRGYPTPDLVTRVNVTLKLSDDVIRSLLVNMLIIQPFNSIRVRIASLILAKKLRYAN